MGTTHQRLKDIAEFLGVSQNKAIQYAVNTAYDALNEGGDLEAELQFKRHGVRAGGVTYLNHSPEFVKRVQKRIKAGVPLANEDDEGLEHNLLFSFLSAKQQARVRAAREPLEKRRLIAGFLAAQA